MTTNETLGALQIKLAVLEDSVDSHTEQLNRIEKNTSELIETFQAFQGAWKVLNWIGKAAKPIALVSAFCAGAYTLFTTGHLPVISK